MPIIRNVVLCGYFYTRPEKKFKVKTVCNFFGNKVSFIGNAIFLTISKNIHYHLLEKNVCKNLWTLLEDNICCNKNERLKFLSLEIVNIQCSLTLHCDRRLITSELLSVYNKSFNIDDVFVIQEDQSPEEPTELEQISADREYLSLRVLTKSSERKSKTVTESGERVRKISIKFVQRKNVKAVSVTLILTECTPTSVQIVDFFKKFSEKLSMYTVSRQTVSKNLLTCLECTPKRLRKTLKSVRETHGITKNGMFTNFLCQALFREAPSELITLGNINEASAFFGRLCEPVQCVVMVVTPHEGHRIQKPRETAKLLLKVILMNTREQNLYAPNFCLEPFCEAASPSAASTPSSNISCDMPVLTAEDNIINKLTSDGPDFNGAVGGIESAGCAVNGIGGFASLPSGMEISSDAERARQELDSHIHINGLEAMAQETAQASQMFPFMNGNNNNNNNALCTIPSSSYMQSNVQTFEDESDVSISEGSDDGNSSGGSYSEEEDDEEQASVINKKLKQTNVKYVEKCIEKNRKRKEQQKIRQRKQLEKRNEMAKRGYTSEFPDITKSFLETNSYYCRNMQSNIDMMYQTFCNISVLAFRLKSAMDSICRSGGQGELACTVCPIHCAEFLTDLKIKGVGRRPAGALTAPATRKRKATAPKKAPKKI